MPDKTELMQEFHRVRDDLRSLLPGVDVHQRIYPSWTLKELLAHLTGWDDATIAALQALKARQATPLLASRGIDAYNAQTVAERTGLTHEQIVREWELVHDQVKAMLEEMEPETLDQEIVSPWGKPMTVAQLLWVMIDHEQEHAADLRDWRATRSGKPQQTL